MIVFSLISPVFLSPTNLFNVLKQISLTGILAIGMTMVIITGGIDLSVGSIIALVTVLVAGNLEHGIFVAILIGLAAGVGIGILNGLGITYGKIQPFIMTLGTMSVASGLAFMYSGGLPISVTDKNFLQLGTGFIGKVPLPAVYFVILLVIAGIILRFTTFGRYIYSIGSNEEAARLSGVNVTKYKIAVYAISGLMAAISGIIFTAQMGIGTAVAGKGYELTAVAATVVGGASLFGGTGSMWTTFLGAAIIGSMSNIMNLNGVNPFIQTFLTGIIIIVAVLMKRNS